MIPVRRRSSEIRHWGVIVLALVCLLLTAVGCDESSSDAAKLEDARIAIDNGNYSKAIDILSGMEGTKEVLEVRASARAGQAGIDTFEILSKIDTDNNSTEGIDLVGKMLGTGADNSLTQAQIQEKAGKMDLAKENLLASVGDNPNALDDDGKTKLAVYALTDTALILGDILCSEYGDSLDPKNAIVLTKDWLNNTLKPVATVVGNPAYDSLAPTTEQLNKLSQNIVYVSNAIQILGNDNDLENEFNQFKMDLSGGDNDITADELKSYLKTL